MKTVKDWILSVQDRDVRDFLLERWDINYRGDSDRVNFNHALTGLCDWRNTPEKEVFWSECEESDDPIAYLRNHLDSLGTPKRIQHNGKWYVLEEEEEIEVLETDTYEYYPDGKRKLLAWKFKDSETIQGFEFELPKGVFKGDNQSFLIGLANDEKDSWDVVRDEVSPTGQEEKEIKSFCKWLENKELI